MRILVTVALAMLAGTAGGESVRAADRRQDARDLRLLRFSVDNDTFVDQDGAYTGGWSIQLHSPLRDEWSSGLEGWVAHVPGFGDDGPGGRIVRTAWGVTQVIITPSNLEISEPQPNDAPWAGMLGAYASWSSYDNERLSALQAYVGCIGSCSHAEEVQKFFHNSLGRGQRPQGWPNQIADELLLNVNYEHRRKLWTRGRHEGGRWSQDVSVGAQAGVGSFATYAQAWLEYRFGWDVPEGFTTFGDPPALGIALDPVYVVPVGAAGQRSWRPYFSAVARLRSDAEFAPLEGGATDNGGFYPRVESVPGEQQVLLGVHVAKGPLAFHLTYHRFLDDEDFEATLGGEIEWVNLSFERRFGRRIPDRNASAR